MVSSVLPSQLPARVLIATAAMAAISLLIPSMPAHAQIPSADYAQAGDQQVGLSGSFLEGRGAQGWMLRYRLYEPNFGVQDPEIPSTTPNAMETGRLRLSIGQAEGKLVIESDMGGSFASEGRFGSAFGMLPVRLTPTAMRFGMVQVGIARFLGEGKELRITLNPLNHLEERITRFEHKGKTDKIIFFAYGADARLFLSHAGFPVQAELYGDVYHLLAGEEYIRLEREELEPEDKDPFHYYYQSGRGVHANLGAEITLKLHKNFSGFLDARMEHLTHKGEWRTTPITAADPMMEIRRLNHQRKTLDIGISYHFGQDAR